jgi:hypothetical protein
MKTAYLTLFALISVIYLCKAQNTFPDSGYVGIGTKSPAYPLHIISSNSASVLNLQNTNSTIESQLSFTGTSHTYTTGVGNGGENYWGVANSWYVFDWTYNSMRMVINPNGYLGIGTVAPDVPLTLVTNNTVDAMRISNTGSGNAVIRYFTADGSSTYFGQVPGTWGGVSGSPSIWQSNRNMVITPVLNSASSGINLLTNGNVGIGSTNPGQKLDVNGNIRIPQNNTIYFDNGNGSGIRQVAGGGFDFIASNAVGNGNITINPSPSGYIYLNYSSGKGVYLCNGASGPTGIISSSGAVGIGTTNPGNYMLSVKGAIHTQSVQVDMTSWNDYVFKPGYHLLPLQEVEKYIERSQHLPEIPSEQQVIENGINVSEMLNIQTKKIEELTLYLIDKDKQLNQQQDQINRLIQQQQQNAKLYTALLDQLKPKKPHKHNKSKAPQ